MMAAWKRAQLSPTSSTPGPILTRVDQDRRTFNKCACLWLFSGSTSRTSSGNTSGSPSRTSCRERSPRHRCRTSRRHSGENQVKVTFLWELSINKTATVINLTHLIYWLDKASFMFWYHAYFFSWDTENISCIFFPLTLSFGKNKDFKHSERYWKGGKENRKMHFLFVFLFVSLFSCQISCFSCCCCRDAVSSMAVLPAGLFPA